MRWQQVVGHVDRALVGDVEQGDCEQTLAYIRQQRPELTPPPLADLEVPVRSWFDEAEHLFFECDSNSEDGGTDTLQALEAEIVVVLSMEK